MHDIAAVARQIARRRLLDVQNAIEAVRGGLPQLVQELEQVADVRTALVEVEDVPPVVDSTRRLDAAHQPIDPNDAIEVGRQDCRR